MKAIRNRVETAPDSELLHMVLVEPDEWRSEVISLAQSELGRRGVPLDVRGAAPISHEDAGHRWAIRGHLEGAARFLRTRWSSQRQGPMSPKHERAIGGVWQLAAFLTVVFFVGPMLRAGFGPFGILVFAFFLMLALYFGAAREGPELRSDDCPFCAAPLPANATKCRYCGSDLGDPPRGIPTRTWDKLSDRTIGGE